MKLALIYGSWSLSFRGPFTFGNLRDDPRGLSGSELAFIRLAELLNPSHDLTLYTDASDAWKGFSVRPLSELGKDSYDAAIVVNEPELLRQVTAKLKVVYHLINSFEFLPTAPNHVDLWLSPSDAHRRMILGQSHTIGITAYGRPSKWKPDPAKWQTLHLGCDPTERPAKIPGRVVYCSSPDRGLHLLLQEWPKIRKAVPHAHLKVFYRLRPWLDRWKTQGYYGPIEGQRHRAAYIEEALRRLTSHGVEVCDSVSRNQISREMAEAEVMAYPCDTVRWTEGFSCSLLEGCAAEACPITTDVDALGEIYGRAIPCIPRGDWGRWSDTVIQALDSTSFREGLFDTIYHEHVSYHSLMPLVSFFRRHNMHLYDAHRVETQGGSVRVFVSKLHRRPSPRLGVLCRAELLLNPRHMGARMQATRDALDKAWPGRCVGYGAPAKLTGILNAFGLDRRHVRAVMDDNALKVGKFTPGTHIPIIKPEPCPDPILLFSWNFADEIVPRLRAQGYTGPIVVPLPEVRVL